MDRVSCQPQGFHFSLRLLHALDRSTAARVDGFVYRLDDIPRGPGRRARDHRGCVIVGIVIGTLAAECAAVEMCHVGEGWCSGRYAGVRGE